MTYVLITLMAVLVFLSMSDFVEGVAQATAELAASKSSLKKHQSQ